jgi:hypothetical protein
MPRLHFQMLDPEPADTDIISRYNGFPIVAVVQVLDELGQTKIRCANKSLMRILGWHFSNSHVLRQAIHEGPIMYDGYQVVKPHTRGALRANQGFVSIHKMKFFAHYQEDD